MSLGVYKWGGNNSSSRSGKFQAVSGLSPTWLRMKISVSNQSPFTILLWRKSQQVSHPLIAITGREASVLSSFVYKPSDLRCLLGFNGAPPFPGHGFYPKTYANMCTDTRCRREENTNISDRFSENKQFKTVATEVCKIIRNRPRWEDTLLSDFPSSTLMDPNCIQEIIKCQNNSLLSFRFFLWICSQDGFNPESSSCNAIFDVLVQAKASKAAQFLLSSTKFFPQPASLESFVQCLCEDGAVEESLHVFSQMKSLGFTPSRAVWNSALLGSLRLGRTDLVWELYSEMMESGIVVDEDTVGYLIQTFLKDNKLLEAYGLLKQVLETGFSPDVTAFTKLISGFCKDRNYGKISELLHLMIAKNRIPSIFTYQEIIHGLCINQKGAEGFRVFNDLKKRGYAPDMVMHTTMIDGLCKMQQMGEARKLWFEMINKGFLPSSYTYNVLINGYCKTGKLEEAQNLYEEMCDRGLKETTISCNTLISGYCLHGRMDDACAIYEEMVKKGIERDTITYNILIQGFCRYEKPDDAVKVFQELLKTGLQPSTSSYTPLIRVLSHMGRVQEAIYLWNDMPSRSVEPLVCTHDYIITGLCKQGNATEGMDWLATMLRSQLKPQGDTFNEIIKCLILNDRLGDALLVLQSMFEMSYALREPVCHIFVHQLCKNNSYQAGECLIEILERK